MAKGIIFDFNGTMLWDADFHEQAWNALAKEVRGTEMTEEELIKHMHGRTNKAITEYVLGREATPEEVTDIAGRKEALYREICLKNPERFKLAPGLIEILDFLKAHEIPCTIATSSDKVNVDFFVENLNLHKWFPKETIIYDDGSFNSKPEPDIFLKAARAMKLNPQDCVAIEDSHSGLIAAERANIGKIIAISPNGADLGAEGAEDKLYESIHRFEEVEWEHLFDE